MVSSRRSSGVSSSSDFSPPYYWQIVARVFCATIVFDVHPDVELKLKVFSGTSHHDRSV